MKGPEPPDPPSQAPNQPGPPSWMTPATPVIPDHELIRRIGGGSYGDVWLARNVLGTWRAVKIVFRDRFTDRRPYEREFNGIQKFEPLSRSNEGFVDILQIGRNDEAGYFYYVMELADDAEEMQKAEGGMQKETLFTGDKSNSSFFLQHSYIPKTLSKVLLQCDRLPVRECLELGMTLNLALAHLHRAGLIHRDIKPSNIIFVGGVPKLADIGLVVETSEARSYVGTEGYIPPEGPTSAQADLYSLGKVLYEASMGKDRKDFPEPFTQIAEAPDSGPLLEFNAILLKACAANVADRYPSAEVMNADLALLQGGGSVRRQRAFTRRLRLVRRAGMVLALLTLLAAAGWFWQARQTRVVRQLVEDKSELLEQNRERLRQFDLANGLRDMDSGDIGSALVWFADGLKYLPADSPQAEMDRFRISMLLKLHPKLLSVFPIASHPTNEFDIECSQNGERMILKNGERREWWELSVPPRKLIDLPTKATWPKWDFSADGRRLVFSARDRPGQEIWKLEPDGSVHVTKIDAGTLQHVRFAWGGKAILGVDTNQALWLIDADSGASIREVTRFDAPMESLVVTQNGERVAVSWTNDLTRVLDLRTGRSIGEVQLNQLTPNYLPIAQGRFLISLPEDGRPNEWKIPRQLWDVTTGQCLGPALAQFDARGGLAVHVSSMGRLWAVGDLRGKVDVLSQWTGDSVVSLQARGARTGSVEVSGDGVQLAIADWAGSARVWDILSGRPLTPPFSIGKPPVSGRFVLNDAALLTQADYGLARMWDVTGMRAGEATLQTPSRILSTRYSPDGTLLFARCDSVTLMWETKNWHLIASIPHASGKSHSAVFSPDSRYVAVADSYQGARVWEARTGQPAGPALRHGTNAVVHVAFSPDQKVLATAGHKDRSVGLWDWRQGVEISPALEHKGEVYMAEFCGGGNRLVSVSFENDCARGLLWDWKVGKIMLDAGSREPRRFWTHEFSHDGSKWLFATRDSKKCELVDTETGNYLPCGITHEDSVLPLDFSSHDRWIVSGGYDHTARIWDTATGQSALPPLQLDGFCQEVHFNGDNRMVATLTQEGGVRLWDAACGLPLAPVMPMGASRVKFHPHRQQLAVGVGDQQIRIFSLENYLPADRLQEFVTLNTGLRLGANGQIERVPAGDLVDLYTELHSAYPERFTMTEGQRVAWHEAQLLEYGSVAQVDSSLYHLDRLLELKPNHSGALDLRSRLEALRIPPRDTNAPPRLLDLTDYYTHSLDGALGALKLDELPRGVQHMDGTDFDIRGMIQLGDRFRRDISLVSEPLRVGRIRVAQRCRQLHFLQACREGSGIAGMEAARFVMHYADGSQKVYPLLYQHQTRGWLRQGISTNEVSQATIAWAGTSDPARWNGQILRLYKATWENPVPEVEITHLDFEVGEISQRPFVVAITAD